MEPEVFHFTTDVRVRLPETDAMGIVFHGYFFTYMEVGRMDYLRNLGLAADIKPIAAFTNLVAHAECDFKSPARFDDALVVAVRIASIAHSSFTFKFRITHRRENRLVALARSVHVAVDETNWRPMQVSDSFRQVVAAYEGRALEMA
ncbi:MAG TPA: thioesterase family protein [Candidatus Xenobia bacterium]|jgi:acyl-CoA thioester hydrolase